MNGTGPDLGAQFDRRALREVVALRQLLDSLEVELVRRVRLDGASWTTIGEELGLTRQGARARHLANDPLPRRERRRVSGLDAYLAQMKARRERISG